MPREPLIIPHGRALKPFQELCVHRMLDFLRKYKGCYNACEMRLGKSIQTLVTCNNLLSPLYKDNYNPTVLIICPAILRLIWKNEVNKWARFRVDSPLDLEPMPNIYWGRGCLHALDLEPMPNIYWGRGCLHALDYGFIYNIVSYDIAKTDAFINVIKRKKIDILILDESHYLTNLKSQRTKQILKKIWPQATYKICLSGTPFRNNVIDAYSLFHKLAPDLFPDWFNFANTYANRKHNGFGVKYEGLKNEDKLKKLINDRFFIRKTRRQVMPELPDKNYIKVSLPAHYQAVWSPEEEELLKAYHKELQELLKSDVPMTSIKPPPVAILRLRRRQAIEKVKPVAEYVENMLEQNVPVLLISVFREPIAQYAEALKKFKPVVIHGGTTSSARTKALHQFTSGGTNILIGQIISAGTGLPLDRTDDIVLADINYSPADVAQVSARGDSMEKKHSVNIHYAVVDGSTDEKVIDRVMKKAELFSRVLG